MKRLFTGLLVSLLFSCTFLTEDPTGVYVSNTTNEFGRVDDTLVIAYWRNNYVIYRTLKTTYRNAGAPKVKKETLMTDYDNDKKQLVILDKGKTLLWDQKNGLMRMGRTEYLLVRK